MALLSSTGFGAKDRILAAKARGWLTTDELPFADDPRALFDRGLLWYPPATESGSFVPREELPTGANFDGTTAENCLDWTSTSALDVMKVGLSGGGAGLWIAFNNISCNNVGPLLCLGVDAAGQVSGPGAVPPGGRRVFLSSPWVPGGGRGGAIAQCMRDAQGAGLPGLYTALLSLPDAGARAALASFDGGYFRPDGVLLEAGVDGLLGATRRAPLDVLADGGHAIGFAWTGGSPNTATSYSCDGWTSDAGRGGAGYLGMSHFGVFNEAPLLPCTEPHPVYCVQVD